MRGGESVFVCKDHAGHLSDLISRKGFVVHRLPVALEPPSVTNELPTSVYAPWLGGNWSDDAQQTRAAIGRSGPVDWVVVDHYAVDYQWEQVVRDSCGQMMVIDDLANRRHDCDLLLDQNLGRKPEDYDGLVPCDARKLLGPTFALLRPEFAQLREYSLTRRAQPRLDRLLIAMGGVDRDNITGKVLDAIDGCGLPLDGGVTVVLGAHAPWLAQVREQAIGLRMRTTVLSGVDHMAQLMADSDLAIGAMGGTSWERCCLGLPAVAFVLAENQRPGALALQEAAAAVLVDDVGQVRELVDSWRANGGASSALLQMSMAGRAVVDGHGTTRVVDALGC